MTERTELAKVIYDAIKAQDVGYCENDRESFESVCFDGYFNLEEVADVLLARRPAPGVAFHPREETLQVLRDMDKTGEVGAAAMNEFLTLLQTENDGRKAGSIVAHHLIRSAAMLLLFGCQVDGHKPRMKVWIDAARDDLEWALKELNMEAERDGHEN